MDAGAAAAAEHARMERLRSPPRHVAAADMRLFTPLGRGEAAIPVDLGARIAELFSRVRTGCPLRGGVTVQRAPRDHRCSRPTIGPGRPTGVSG